MSEQCGPQMRFNVGFVLVAAYLIAEISKTLDLQYFGDQFDWIRGVARFAMNLRCLSCRTHLDREPPVVQFIDMNMRQWICDHRHTTLMWVPFAISRRNLGNQELIHSK
jgi:hypothetical protein